MKHIFKEDAIILQISAIVKKTEELFDLFNQHFYDGELARPAITVSPDGGRGSYGWCSVQEVWKTEREMYREINSIKYVCPECGAIIRATKEVNVVCGDCDVPFERE